MARKQQGIEVIDLLNKNKRADVYYRKAMQAEVTKYLKMLIKDIERVYTTIKVNNAKYERIDDRKPSAASVKIIIDKYRRLNSRILLKNSEKIFAKWLKMIKYDSRSRAYKHFKRLYGEAFSINFDKKSYDEVFKLIIQKNVALIKSVNAQDLSNIEQITYDSMITGESWSNAYNKLSEEFTRSDHRIKFIARDQTAKANQAITELMQKDAGIEYWQWSTAKDERVSTGYGGHKQLEGKIYAYAHPEDYPIIDSYGNRGAPSTRPNCRCVALAVFIDDGYKAVKQSDGSYKIKKE